MVATMGETTGSLALRSMRRKMMANHVGQQILRERPRINTSTVDLDYLRTLPADTLGKEYVNWLDKNKASPDERLPVQYVDDPDLAYVMQRYREVHDLLHTVLGMPTNLLGEIVVKWVEALQTGLPMCALGAMFAPLRLGPRHRQKYLQEHMWWALRNGYNAKFLMNVYYEKYWETTLEELREMLNLEPPPETPEKKVWDH